MHMDQGEQDFIPLVGGNNFEVLHRSRRDYDMEDLEEEPGTDGDSDSDSDSETDSDELDDDDMDDTQDISINIEESLPTNTKRKTPKPTVMFTIPAAVAIYKKMYQSRFLLTTLSLHTRYGLFQEDTSPDSGVHMSLGSSAVSRPSSVSATSEEPPVAVEVAVSGLEDHNPARDYVFNWGVNTGKRFIDVDDKYLRTIGGQLYRYIDKHPGLLEAFEYHRPGQARLSASQHAKPKPKHSQAGPSQSQPGRTKAKQPAQQAASQPPSHDPSPKGKSRSHKRKRDKKRQQL